MKSCYTCNRLRIEKQDLKSMNRELIIELYKLIKYKDKIEIENEILQIKYKQKKDELKWTSNELKRLEKRAPR